MMFWIAEAFVVGSSGRECEFNEGMNGFKYSIAFLES